MLFPGIYYSDDNLEQGNIIVANKNWIPGKNNRSASVDLKFSIYRWEKGKYKLIYEGHLTKFPNM